MYVQAKFSFFLSLSLLQWTGDEKKTPLLPVSMWSWRSNFCCSLGECTWSLSRQLPSSNLFHWNNVWVAVAATTFLKVKGKEVTLSSYSVWLLQLACWVGLKRTPISEESPSPIPKAGRVYALCQMQAQVRENRDENYLHSSGYSRRSINFATCLIRNCDFKNESVEAWESGKEDLIGFSFA